jgi:CBS domain-containing protein
MHVSQICTHDVVTCSPDASALEMARLMREQHVGDVVVVDTQEGRTLPVGIVTDRDLITEVMAHGLDPEMPKAHDLMRDDLVTVATTDSIYDALLYMRTRGIRRLPVVDSHGVLAGMLTADDATRFLADALTEIARIPPQQVHREQRNFVPAA